MKRFYKEATATEADGGWQILLDGRPVRTPARALLILPNAALGEAVAQEWAAQGEEIDPASMPMTGIANAALDHVTPDPAAFAAPIIAYGESDLLCYRAEGPEVLVQRQEAAWSPLLGWAEAHYGAHFAVTSGILHVAQPQETLKRMAEAVLALPPFLLAPLSTLVTMSGSLIIGLAAVERAFPLQELWQAAELDELWQAEQWGDDDQALKRRAQRHEEFMTVARFADLAAD
ncbi:MAG: ATP12 family protein [Sphingomonadaceae bacterium]|jgi:chaperone required for assembly of F1-ATPase